MTENPIFQVKYNNGSVAPEVRLVYRYDDNSGHKAGDPISGNATEMVSISNYDIGVGNTPGAVLPSAGGSGTKMILLAGCFLTMLAGMGLVMKRRRKETEKEVN